MTVPVIALIMLCITQAYTWWRFTTFETLATTNLIAMHVMYAPQVLELQQEVAKLKEQLKKYEESKTVDN